MQMSNKRSLFYKFVCNTLHDCKQRSPWMGDRNTLPVRLHVSFLSGTTTFLEETLVTTTTTTTTPPPTCPSNYHWDPSIPFCHKITTDPKSTWPEARTACQTVGADLAIIDVSAKFSKILSDRKCLSKRVFIISF